MNAEIPDETINKNYKWAKTLDWESQAKRLIDYIVPLTK